MPDSNHPILNANTDPDVTVGSKSRRWTISILVLTVLFVGMTHYTSTSPLRNIIQHRPLLNCDNNPTRPGPSVFLYMGRLVLSGGMPYRDAFDHKGPLLYLLNASGLIIHGVFGVWLLELVFLAVSTVFTYKTARLFSSSGAALLTTVVSVFWYTALCDNNYCETWTIPFLLISLYNWVMYCRGGHQIALRNTFVVGLCFGAVLLLKPNLTALWILFCLTVAIAEVRHHRYAQLTSHIVFFLLGAAFILAPILGWLWKNGAWNEFIEQEWHFNRIYCHVPFGERLIAFTRCFSCFRLESYFVPFAAIGYLALAYRAETRRDRTFFLLMETFLFLSLVLLSLSARTYHYYSIPLVVPLLPFLASAFSWSIKTDTATLEKFSRRALLVLLLIPTIFYDIPLFRPVRDVAKIAALRRIHPDVETAQLFRGYGYPYTCDESDAIEIAGWLRDNTTPETRIANFGLGGRLIYWHANRRCVTKYFYFNRTHVENGYLPEILADLKEKAPEVFIYQRSWGDGASLFEGVTFRDDEEKKPGMSLTPIEITDWINAEGYQKAFENTLYEIWRK